MSFILGFIMDVFLHSYGIHTFASVLIAYIKILWISKINHGKDFEDTLEIHHLSLRQFIFIATYFIIIHHFILFFLESFSIYKILIVFQTTFLSTVFTLVLLIIHKFFSIKKR